jgi:transposase
MIGPIFDQKKKLPLQGIRHFYELAPTDMLFSKGVTLESLNDNALARNLDSLSDAGLYDLFWKCSGMIKRRFGLNSNILHTDSTDVSVYALRSEDPGDGSAFPAYSGNPKDGRGDLLRYNMATVTDGDRILQYCRTYSGNMVDAVMNRDTLDFLRTRTDVRESVIIADCKLVNSILITEMQEMGLGFISKVPQSFSEKIREKAVEFALSSEMKDSSVPGYRVCETELKTVCGELRFIAYRSAKGKKRSGDYLERHGKKTAENRFKPFLKKKFACEADALSAFDDVMKKHVDSAYVVLCDIVSSEETVPRKGRGRHPADYIPETKMTWKVIVSMSFDKERASELTDLHNTSVIVTNIPYASADHENVRYGATTDTILRLYLDQYKIEQSYRLMKSGMGIDSVFVRTPSRASALFFVIGIAVLISNVVDALLRQSGKGRTKTMRQSCIEIQNAVIEYHRSENAISIPGSEAYADRVFSFMDSIGVDPSKLLEIFDG